MIHLMLNGRLQTKGERIHINPHGKICTKFLCDMYLPGRHNRVHAHESGSPLHFDLPRSGPAVLAVLYPCREWGSGASQKRVYHDLSCYLSAWISLQNPWEKVPLTPTKSGTGSAYSS